MLEENLTDPVDIAVKRKIVAVRLARRSHTKFQMFHGRN